MTPEVITIWHWWGLGGALMTVELFVPGFFLWLGAPAALVGLALLAWPGMPPIFQLILFAALAVTSMIAWRRYRTAVASSGKADRETAPGSGL